MEKVLTNAQAENDFNAILDGVQYQGNQYVIERKGRPTAAVIPIAIYENWKRNRARLFALIQQAQGQSGEQDEDEIMELVLEAQTAIRSETAIKQS